MSSTDCMEIFISKPLLLLNLPTEIIEMILSYLTYDETSAVRLVSRRFDSVCRARLNDGLNRVDRLHFEIHREVKGKLPRRESERRNHVLARHIDILSAIETRLSLLNMTYSKYIDLGLCCFIPGKVLDEMFHVLREIRRAANPPRAHELLQELRDISSMAIEHFDEKIVPLLKPETENRFKFTDSIVPLANVTKVQKAISQRSFMQSTIIRFQKRLIVQQKLSRIQSRRVVALEKNLNEQINNSAELRSQQLEQNQRIAELEQKIVDYDQKFVDMMVEISRVRSASGVQSDGSMAKDGMLEARSTAEHLEEKSGLEKPCQTGRLSPSPHSIGKRVKKRPRRAYGLRASVSKLNAVDINTPSDQDRFTDRQVANKKLLLDVSTAEHSFKPSKKQSKRRADNDDEYVALKMRRSAYDK